MSFKENKGIMCRGTLRPIPEVALVGDREAVVEVEEDVAIADQEEVSTELVVASTNNHIPKYTEPYHHTLGHSHILDLHSRNTVTVPYDHDLSNPSVAPSREPVSAFQKKGKRVMDLQVCTIFPNSLDCVLGC